MDATISKLTRLLRRLEADKTDRECLLRLQAVLVARIRRTERQISDLKMRLRELNRERKAGRRSKSDSLRLKEQIARSTAGIDEAQQHLFIWRCFGDGIPFLYADKYALKHMLYNTKDYSVKPPPGALLNKAGLRAEWSLVRELVANEVPAVLCDITNTLRHGDVCALIGPDPIPLEVKSSATRGVRSARQITSLRALTQFLETDEATRFRGLPYVKRVELSDAGLNHGAAMNDCIERSQGTGISVVCPERGVTYIAMRNKQSIDELGTYIRPDQMVAVLNQAVTDRAWMPYYPFTLSIRDERSLLDFIEGRLVLLVALDKAAVVDSLQANGLKSEFVDDENVILVAARADAKPEDTSILAISRQFFGRLFFEFGSIKGLAESEAVRIEQIEKAAAELDRKVAAGELNSLETPRGWPEYVPAKWRPPSQ